MINTFERESSKETVALSVIQETRYNLSGEPKSQKESKISLTSASTIQSIWWSFELFNPESRFYTLLGHQEQLNACPQLIEKRHICVLLI